MGTNYSNGGHPQSYRGKAWRRHQHQNHDKAWRFIIDKCHADISAGYYRYVGIPYLNGTFDKKYIVENSRLKVKKWFKQYSSQQIRRRREKIPNGNYYKKCCSAWYWYW